MGLWNSMKGLRPQVSFQTFILSLGIALATYFSYSYSQGALSNNEETAKKKSQSDKQKGSPPRQRRSGGTDKTNIAEEKNDIKARKSTPLFLPDGSLSDGDTPLSLGEYAPGFPDESRTLLEEGLGVKSFARYSRSLIRPPTESFLRVQFVPALQDETIEEEERVRLAMQDIQACLQDIWQERIEQTGRPFPAPIVRRHSTLSDVLVIPSVPSKLSALELPRGTDSRKLVIVDRMCGEAVLRGSDIFAKGIILCSANLWVRDRVEVWVDIGDSERARMKGDRPPISRGRDLRDYYGKRVFVGYGIAAMNRQAIMSADRGLAVQVSERVCWDGPPLNGIVSKRVYAQNLPSMLSGYALDPRPGESVIDMCAAPGGKSTHLASLMRNDGILISCDNSKRKVQGLSSLMHDLGFTNAYPITMDSRNIVLKDTSGHTPRTPREIIEAAPLAKQKSKTVKASRTAKKQESAKAKLSEQRRAEKERYGQKVSDHAEKQMETVEKPVPAVKQVKGFDPNSFDRVLLDPPCSALGLRPRLLVDVSKEELEQVAAMQKQLIWAAVKLLKPGGRLVYSTCTVNPLENEATVRHILDAYPCMKLIEVMPKLGSPGLDGFGLSAEQCTFVQRFQPEFSSMDFDEKPVLANDSTGFFVAAFQKDGLE